MVRILPDPGMDTSSTSRDFQCYKKLQIQTEICFSSNESEYVGLSFILHKVILIMEIIKEMNKLKLVIFTLFIFSLSHQLAVCFKW